MTFAPRARTFALLALTTAAAVTAITSGCGGSYSAESTTPGPDASGDAPAADGTTAADAAVEASSCAADLLTDAKNCGRCGHDCLGGACQSGKCTAFALAAPGGPLRHALLYGPHLYVSTVVKLSTQLGGLWRVPKVGGAPEAFVALRYAEAMAVLDGTLYFVVDDLPADGADATGGLYSCPLAGSSPCAPTLIAAADSPRAIAVDQGRVFYTDKAAGKGLMVYSPPGPPTLFRPNPDGAVGVANNLYVDGTAAFYSVQTFSGPVSQHGRLTEILPDGGEVDTYSYASASANDGRLFGTSDTLFFTAYDNSNTTGGIVRRIPRKGGALCDLGGSGNKRPYGVYADASGVYWANQGGGAAPPYSNGSIASCAQADCCTTPAVLWTGPQQPTAVTGDADAIYFVTYDGTIWKVAKP